MRTSLFHIVEEYITTARPEDFELVRDYVVELTRKVSLEEMGVDLTTQNTGDFRQGFTIEKPQFGPEEKEVFVLWSFLDDEKRIDILWLRNEIVKHFWPDIKFQYSWSARSFSGGTRKNWRVD